MKLHKYTPISVVWETTLKCNMKCLHCGSSAGNIRVNELTTKEGFKLCEDLKKLGTRLISLMGGEPFLRNDWNKLAQYIRKLDMNVTIMSNGLLINEKIISELTKINPYAVTISLDGGIPKTHDTIRGVKNSYKKCINSLDLLTDANLPTTVITTVHKKNFKELPLIRDLLINRGIAWQIQMATPVGRFPKDLMLSFEEFYSVALFIASTRKNHSIKELPVMGAHNFGYFSKILPNLMLLPWIGCQAGLTAMGIQSNGTVQGCLSLPDRYNEGNIRDRSLIDIWTDPNSFPYNRIFTKENLDGECRICKHNTKCKGGCFTVAIAINKDKRNNPYCLRSIEKNILS